MLSRPEKPFIKQTGGMVVRTYGTFSNVDNKRSYFKSRTNLKEVTDELVFTDSPYIQNIGATFPKYAHQTASSDCSIMRKARK
jgi:hypothetical protein